MHTNIYLDVIICRILLCIIPSINFACRIKQVLRLEHGNVTSRPYMTDKSTNQPADRHPDQQPPETTNQPTDKLTDLMDQR